MSNRRPPQGAAFRLLWRELAGRDRGPLRGVCSADWPGPTEGAERLEARAVFDCVRVGEWLRIERIDGVLVFQLGRHRGTITERRDGGAVVRITG